MDSWTSYPSIFALGHAAIKAIFDGPVIVEEKIDGSQFSWGTFRTPDGERLLMRSKGAQIDPDAPPKMFTAAVESVRARAHLLTPNWTYRAEYLAKPKHNVLAYDRHPIGHLIVFNINDGLMSFLSPEAKAAEAQRIGLECVPQLACRTISGAQDLRTLLDTTSVLGGQQIEGVVVKPLHYDRFGVDKKVLLGKFVSEAFKEHHQREWKTTDKKDILSQIIDTFRTSARWGKAVQHLRDAGTLTDSPKDIGPLIGEVWEDIQREEGEAIKEALFKWAKKDLARGVVRGLPEWYKERLLEQQFERTEDHDDHA